MNTSSVLNMIAAVAASLVISGCYTQFGSTQEDQPPEDITYSESDSAEENLVSPESYDDARYRFYVGVGYPYWSPVFSVGFWDPYPFDPWLWGPPAYWYPYGAYYGYGWYYPPAAYYPPGYWYGSPVPAYPAYAGYTNRAFGTTRGYGATRTGEGGTYRGATTPFGARPALTPGVRPASRRPGGVSSEPAVKIRSKAGPAAVDQPASTPPSVRRGKDGSRNSTPAVRPAPEQRKPGSSGSRQSVAPKSTPDRRPEGTSARPKSNGSGDSRSYSPPPSSPPSNPSGSSGRSGSSSGGSSSPRSGGRR